MEVKPIYLILFQSFPETAVLISLGLVLIGVKPRLKETICIAFVISLAAYKIRALLLPAGMNVLIQLPVLVLLVAALYHLRIVYAFLASCMGLICLGLTETVFNSLLAKISRISIDQALSDPLLHLLFPLPEFIFLAVVVLILLHFDLAVFDIRELSQSKTGETNEQ